MRATSVDKRPMRVEYILIDLCKATILRHWACVQCDYGVSIDMMVIIMVEEFVLWFGVVEVPYTLAELTLRIYMRIYLLN